MKANKNEFGFSEKWSPEIEQHGFTQVPNLLLACQGHLGLKDGELTTLLQLLTFWFDHDGRVYPSIATLARFSHKGYSTVQKRLRALEEKDFVKRHRNEGTSSNYDLTPCVIQLYKHQKVCEKPLHRRSRLRVEMKRQPSSFPTNKQYEPKRRNSKEKGSSVSAILAHKYGGSSWQNH
jgi:predicted transcriptional regulator